jgi:hypothetical protein
MTAQQSMSLNVPLQPVLTPRQQLAWDLIRSIPGGVTAFQIGTAIQRATDSRNPYWAESTGNQTCRSKALKPLVIKRRATGKYEPRRPGDRAKEASAQTDDLDGLFGGP